MSFSKGIKLGTVLKEEDGTWDGNRGEHTIVTCSYPNCHNRKIERNQDAVFWDNINLTKDEFERNLSPLAKLAAVANPTDFIEKYGHYYVNIGMHAGCAAEWGMHLIKDGLNSHNVGIKLRQEKPNAIQK